MVADAPLGDAEVVAVAVRRSRRAARRPRHRRRTRSIRTPPRARRRRWPGTGGRWACARRAPCRKRRIHTRTRGSPDPSRRVEGTTCRRARGRRRRRAATGRSPRRPRPAACRGRCRRTRRRRRSPARRGSAGCARCPLLRPAQPISTRGQRHEDVAEEQRPLLRPVEGGAAVGVPRGEHRLQIPDRVAVDDLLVHLADRGVEEAEPLPRHPESLEGDADVEAVLQLQRLAG